MRTICRTLGIGRATVYRASTPRARRYAKADDRAVAAQLRVVLRHRATYGSRRATALVKHEYPTSYNRKRVRRVTEREGWTLPTRQRRTGRAHTGRAARESSNERWCSDSFQVPCRKGDAERLGLCPVTTPAYSSESNGMAEAFVHTIKRDYVSGADLSSAAVVLDQLPEWIADYNHVAHTRRPVIAVHGSFCPRRSRRPRR